MFWLTGLVAMAIESKSVRRCMGSLALQQSSSLSKNVEEPATYTSSFNPFPALVVGVTGVSMAAHAQTYLFQVSNMPCVSVTRAPTIRDRSRYMFCGEICFWLLPSCAA